MEALRLSLCMIVRNEEDCIARCLDSVKDVVDEIIIVDTGSTDKTIEICKSFQAQIYKFNWNGSFADARNFGIEKASGDWIIWLDADEEVDAAGRQLLRNEDYFMEYDVLTVHLVNYYGDQIDKDKTTDIAHTRLFRSNMGIKFINKIHECLDIVEMDQERIGHLPVKVHHYGYLDIIVDKKGKFERNLKMLELQLQENENAYWAHYYIAMEYYRKGELHEAFKRVNQSIRAFLEAKLLPPSMVYKLKYSILIALGSDEGAWPGILKAIALYPDYVDLHFFMGLILYQMKKYKAALECFERCIEMGEGNINHLVLRGVGSFQAWFYKGLSEQKLKRIEAAAASFLRSLAISPKYQPAFEALKEIHKAKNIPIDKILKENFTGQDYHALESLIQMLN